MAQVRRLSGHKFMNLNFDKYGWQEKLFGALISGRREIDKKDNGARKLAQDGLATIQVAYAVGGCSEESILTQYMKERLGAAGSSQLSMIQNYSHQWTSQTLDMIWPAHL